MKANGRYGKLDVAQVPYSALTFTMQGSGILSLYQINNRHCDETMRGLYDYAPVIAVVGRLIDPNGPISSKNLILVAKEYEAGDVLNINLDNLDGKYVLFYRYEWTYENTERKAVICLYGE